MLELVQESIKLVNLPYTILFGSTLLYWIFYLLGVLESDVLDFLGMSEVSDGAAGTDGEPEINSAGGGLLASMIRFVHGGDVPVTVIATTLSMILWVLSVLANYFLMNSSILIGLLLAVPLFVAGILATRLVLMPFVPLLIQAFDESSDTVELLGRSCTVVSIEVSPRHGQAEVTLPGSPLLINVKSREGELLKKGDEAVVFDKDADGIYVIAPLGTLANE